MVLERQYIIPLRREWLKSPKHKRAKKAVAAVRQFLARHMRAEIEDIKVERWLNEELWKRGEKKPPHKIRVKAVKDDNGIVRAEIIELSERAKKIEAKENARVMIIDKKKKAEEEKKKAEEEAKKKEEEEKKKAEEAKKTEEEKAKEKEEKKVEEEKEKEMHTMVKAPKEHKPTAQKEKKATKHPFRQALKK